LPEPQVAEAQRREFFQQLHRWLRQDYFVHVFCNNDGERQRFEEIWGELVGQATRLSRSQEKFPEKPGNKIGDRRDACPALHLGSLTRGFICDEAKLVVVTDAEIFGRYKVQRPRRLKSPHALAARSALDIDFTDLEEGDLVVHLQHGIGRYLGLKNLPGSADKSEIGNRKSNAWSSNMRPAIRPMNRRNCMCPSARRISSANMSAPARRIRR
jgi:transcription-repair coupling factor (superfamily II helicase)